MKAVEALKFPTDNMYTAEHIWVRKDDDTYLVGVSDFAQDQLGEIVFVEFPLEGEHLKAGTSFGDIESMKSVNKLMMPVNGTIVAINEDLEDTPTLINMNCYTTAWLLRIRADSDADVDALLSAEAYKQLLS